MKNNNNRHMSTSKNEDTCAELWEKKQKKNKGAAGARRHQVCE